MSLAPFVSRWAPRALKAGTTLGKVAFGGAGERALLGAAVGAVYGGVTSDSQTPEGIVASIMRGAVGGGALGAATRLVTPALKSYNGKSYMSAPYLWGTGTGRLAAAAGRGAGRIGLGALNAVEFGINHPGLVLGSAAAIGGAVMLNSNVVANTSPTMRNVRNRASYDNEQGALDSMSIGMAPMGSLATGAGIRRQHFQNSTNGLVQGLHRGRH